MHASQKNPTECMCCSEICAYTTHCTPAVSLTPLLFFSQHGLARVQLPCLYTVRVSCLSSRYLPDLRRPQNPLWTPSTTDPRPEAVNNVTAYLTCIPTRYIGSRQTQNVARNQAAQESCAHHPRRRSRGGEGHSERTAAGAFPTACFDKLG